VSSNIKAVTFDLWDTMIADESDEPKRKEQGLRSKAGERPHLVWEALNGAGSIPFADVSLAYAVTDAAFIRVWKEHAITWTIEERLDVVFKGLGRGLDGPELERLVQALADMEVDIPPDPIPGVEECLKTLAGRYKLCVISDTILTPGTGLRRLLDVHGLKQYFSGFVFSDEVGHSKPHRGMFDAAAAQLGVEFSEMVHIGDRDSNDVKGPQALGMKAVLFTGRRAHDADMTSADAVCGDHASLPAAIDAL
jgi:HAD superfamily hydrolase (TIGR01549 family)